MAYGVTSWVDLLHRWAALWSQLERQARPEVPDEFYELLLAGLMLRTRVPNDRQRAYTTETGMMLWPWSEENRSKDRTAHARCKIVHHLRWWLATAPLLVTYCERHHGGAASDERKLVLNAWKEWQQLAPAKLVSELWAATEKHRTVRRNADAGTVIRDGGSDPSVASAGTRREDQGGPGASSIRAHTGSHCGGGQAPSMHRLPDESGVPDAEERAAIEEEETYAWC